MISHFHFTFCNWAAISILTVFFFLSPSLLAVVEASERTVNFVNRCSESIWVGGVGSPLDVEDSGFEVQEGKTKSISVSEELRSARFWARTDCEWLTDPNWETTAWPTRFVCASGDCGGPSNNYAVECGSTSGQPPVSLIEMTLSSATHDTYDLSNVDGYSIGYSVKPFGPQMSRLNNPELGEYNCGDPFCKLDVNLCPEELQIMSITNDTYCLSLCAAVSDPQQVAKHAILQTIVDAGQTDLVCCRCGCGTGCGCESPDSKFCCSPFNDNLPVPHGGICDLEAMPKVQSGHFAGQPYEDVFKQQCPEAYSWQFNDDESTYQCLQADYEITFCPANLNVSKGSGVDAATSFFLILLAICLVVYFICFYIRHKHPASWEKFSSPISEAIVNSLCCKCLRPKHQLQSNESSRGGAGAQERRTVALLGEETQDV